ERLRLLDADLIDAVLVAVERQYASIRDMPQGFDGRDNDIWRESVVRMRIRHQVKERCLCARHFARKTRASALGRGRRKSERIHAYTLHPARTHGWLPHAVRSRRITSRNHRDRADSLPESAHPR